MTTEPGDEKAAGGSGRGHFRASQADREQVIAALRAAFIQGRLTRDEFDLRVGRALGARTYAELAALTGDLPAGLTGPVARNARGRASSPGAAAGHAGLPGSWLPPRSSRPLSRWLPSATDLLPSRPRGRRERSCMWPPQWGDTGHDRHQHGGQADQDRRYPFRDRDHAGREDRLRRRRASASPRSRPPPKAGKPIKIGGFPGRSRSRQTGRPPTSRLPDLPPASPAPGTVTPVATGTNTPDKPIKISGFPAAIAITPDGKTAYVVSLPMGNHGHPDQHRHQHAGQADQDRRRTPQSAVAIAITPDGKTAYVVRATVREQRSPRSRPPPTCRAGRSASAVSAVLSM